MREAQSAPSASSASDQDRPEWWSGAADPSDADALLAAYDALDALLVANGFPPTSPWWRERVEVFFRSGRKTSVWRVGRRGGKSSTMCRVLVTLAVAARWPITPGDVGVIVIVSVDSGEATCRLTMIRAILEALAAVPFAPYSDPTSSGLKLLDRPVQFRVKSCSISGTSGFTAIAVLADEMAKWRSPSDGKNPSEEILTSLRATTATIHCAKIFAVSSAFSTADHHAQLVELGDSEEADQMVFIGATWECNPTLTEQDTRKLERDVRKHDREYGSIPTDSGANPWFVECDREESDAIEPALIDVASPNYGDAKAKFQGRSFAGIDAGFRRNASALVIVRWTEDRKLQTAEVVKLVPKPGISLKPSAVFGEFAEIMRAHGVISVAADQHYVETAIENLPGFDVVELPGGQPGKVDAYTRARDALRERVAKIPRCEADLIRQLRQVSYKLSSGGTVSITSPTINGQHGDVASAWVGAIWLAVESGPGQQFDQAKARVDTRWEDYSGRGFG